MMLRRLVPMVIVLLAFGVAVAEDDGVARFAESISRASDQRNPDRVVSRAFGAVLNARISVTGSLAELIEQDFEGAVQAMNDALQHANRARTEFERLAEVAEADEFGLLVLFRRGDPVVLDDFGLTLDFMRDETEALEALLGQLLERGFTYESLQRIRSQAQALEDYTAAYFGLIPQGG